MNTRLSFSKYVLAVTIGSAIAVVAAFSLAAAVEAQSASYFFNRNLGIGSSGQDVAQLQQFLIGRGILTNPSNSPLGVFEISTQRALAAYQQSVGIFPAQGYFGPITRQHFNSGAVGGTTGNTGSSVPCPAGFVCVPVGSSGNSGNNGGSNNGNPQGGSGDINDFDIINDFDDEELEEGDEEEVFGFEFEAQDSDILVENLELLFERVSSNTNDNNDPWDLIESIRLLRDGDEIASMDTDDDDDWDEESNNQFTIEIEDIDGLVNEDDDAEFTIEIEAAGNIDEDDLPVTFDISIADDGLQMSDGDKDDLEEGDEDETRRFKFVENASNNGNNNGDADINITIDDNDRDIDVSENSPTDGEEIMEFDIESEDEDITVESLTFEIEVLDGDTDIEDVIDSLTLIADGDDYGTENVSSSNDSDEITFDNLNIDIDENEEITFIIEADINQQDGNYDDGVEIRITLKSFEGEDEDGDNFDEDIDEDGGDITLNVD